MEIGRCTGADVFFNRGFVIVPCAGRELRLNQIANGGCAHHLSHPADRAGERMQIFGIGKIFGEDARMRQRVGTAQQDMAAATRSAGADYDGEAVAFREQVAETEPDASSHHQRRDHHHDRIRDGERGIAAHVPAGGDIALGE